SHADERALLRRSAQLPHHGVRGRRRTLARRVPHPSPRGGERPARSAHARRLGHRRERGGGTRPASAHAVGAVVSAVAHFEYWRTRRRVAGMGSACQLSCMSDKALAAPGRVIRATTKGLGLATEQQLWAIAVADDHEALAHFKRAFPEFGAVEIVG